MRTVGSKGSVSGIMVFRGNNLEMIWSHTRTIMAKMIDLKFFRNRTVSYFIGDSMCKQRRKPFTAKLPISSWSYISFPKPTGIGFLYFFPESFNKCVFIVEMFKKRITVLFNSFIVFIAQSFCPIIILTPINLTNSFRHSLQYIDLMKITT